jgi:hypothetical protein
MSYTLGLLRADLRTALGVDNQELTDAAADRLLNRSWWEMQSIVRFSEGEGESSFLTVDGTREYNMPTSDIMAVQSVILQHPEESDYTRLIRIDDWNMFPLRDDSRTGRPTHYSRRDDKFILFPNPDREYQVRVKYRKTLEDISVLGPEIPQEWHEVILWGAVSRGFDLFGDVNRATVYRNKQALSFQLLESQETKELEDLRYSGVTILRRRYP